MQCVKCVQQKLKGLLLPVQVREAITIHDGQAVCEFHVVYMQTEQERFRRDTESVVRELMRPRRPVEPSID